MSVDKPILIPQVEDPKNGKASINRESKIKTSGLDNFREKLFADGILKKAAGLITSSKRQGLITYYESAWGKWDSWCSRKVDPISGPPKSVRDFLPELFHSGFEWSKIASYRFSISAFHDRPEGFSVGKHPRICSLLKGIFNKRAPIPRYTFIWDVQKVTTYLSTVGMLEHLNDKMLTLTTTMLIALMSSSRAHEICS